MSYSGEPVEDYLEAIKRGVPFRDSDGSVEYPTVSSRPAPDVDLDPFHRILMIASLAVAIIYTAWMLFRIPSLPEEVPLHFAPDGAVNRYGSPWEMAAVAGGLLIIIIGIAIIARYPRIFNYGVGKLTPENVQAHYRNGVQMMAWMVFTMTAQLIVSGGAVAGDWPVSPAVWFVMALLVGSFAFFALRMYKISKSESAGPTLRV